MRPATHGSALRIVSRENGRPNIHGRIQRQTLSWRNLYSITSESVEQLVKTPELPKTGGLSGRLKRRGNSTPGTRGNAGIGAIVPWFLHQGKYQQKQPAKVFSCRRICGAANCRLSVTGRRPLLSFLQTECLNESSLFPLLLHHRVQPVQYTVLLRPPSLARKHSL